MMMKTINSIQNGVMDITLEYYDKSECKNILLERNSYVLEGKHSWGEDYGGSQCSDETETTYEEIIPERIPVRDGHFAGVSISVEYDSYNGDGNTICYMTFARKKWNPRFGFWKNF